MIETTLCYIEAHGKYLMLHRTKKENISSRQMDRRGRKTGAGETPGPMPCSRVREETGLELADYRMRAKIEFI